MSYQCKGNRVSPKPNAPCAGQQPRHPGSKAGSTCQAGNTPGACHLHGRRRQRGLLSGLPCPQTLTGQEPRPARQYGFCAVQDGTAG